MRDLWLRFPESLAINDLHRDRFVRSGNATARERALSLSSSGATTISWSGPAYPRCCELASVAEHGVTQFRRDGLPGLPNDWHITSASVTFLSRVVARRIDAFSVESDAIEATVLWRVADGAPALHVVGRSVRL